MGPSKRFKILPGILLVASLAGWPGSGEAHHRPDHTGGPGQAIVTEVQALKFGLLVPGVSGGTLTVSETGAVSPTGTVVSLGGTSQAQVSVNSCVGSVTTMGLTNGIVTGPGGTLNITNLTCIGPGGTSGAGGCTYSGTAGTDVVSVGGLITLPAGTTPGIYTGTIDVFGHHNPPC